MQTTWLISSYEKVQIIEAVHEDVWNGLILSSKLALHEFLAETQRKRISLFMPERPAGALATCLSVEQSSIVNGTQYGR